MNKSFLIIGIPAILVAAGFIVTAVYSGAHLTYYRVGIAALVFVLALYFVRKYQKKKSGSKTV
ncbi:MAG TPA: hypothetical protein VLV89_01235 [Candidatus Acidoferrum sp.]|nr:hypothetical protein [Candidatus Acidoferrum sp.]